MAVRRARRSPVPREAEIQRNGMELLRSFRWVPLRRNTGAVRASYKGRERLMRFSTPGASDVYGFTDKGFHFEWEVKRPGERPTPAQVAWLRSMNGVGGAVAFWTDNLADLEEVIRHVMAGGRIDYPDDGDGSYRLVP